MCLHWICPGVTVKIALFIGFEDAIILEIMIILNGHGFHFQKYIPLNIAQEIVNKDIGDGDDKQQFGSQNKKGR